MTALPKLDQFSRIVVKVGSSLLVDAVKGALKQDWLEALVDDLAALHQRGADVIVVSSGAIALGRRVAGLKRGALKLEDSQAAAAIGQIALARAWSETLHRHGVVAGQVLLTLQDTEERRRYLNARETLGRLSAMRAVPVINENDTVATSEIRYGDNDRLAARVATMASADLLILLSDVAGLYDAPPQETPTARLILLVERLTPQIEAMAGGAASEASRGGMRTKIEAARIAGAGGAHMVIADGRVAHPIARVGDGGPCTWVLTPSNPVTARKAWIVTEPLSSSVPAIHALRAVTGLDGVRNQVQGPPSQTRAIGWEIRPSAITICAPPAPAMRAASILVRMPPRDASEAAPPAIASICGVRRSTTGISRADGLSCGGAS